MLTQLNKNINFKGIPVSDIHVRGLESKIRIHKLTKNDTEFIDKLCDNINLSELMPKIQPKKLDFWKSIIEWGLNASKQSDKKGYLLTYDGIPCGNLTYAEYPDKFHLNYVSTWPIQKEQKVPFAGQVLFKQLYEDFIQSKLQKIELNASRFSPFSIIGKYLQLGFKMLGGDDCCEKMATDRTRVLQTLQKLNQIIEIKPIIDAPEENLAATLKLNINES